MTLDLTEPILDTAQSLSASRVSRHRCPRARVTRTSRTWRGSVVSSVGRQCSRGTLDVPGCRRPCRRGTPRRHHQQRTTRCWWRVQVPMSGWAPAPPLGVPGPTADEQTVHRSPYGHHRPSRQGDGSARLRLRPSGGPRRIREPAAAPSAYSPTRLRRGTHGWSSKPTPESAHHSCVTARRWPGEYGVTALVPARSVCRERVCAVASSERDVAAARQ